MIDDIAKENNSLQKKAPRQEEKAEGLDAPFDSIQGPGYLGWHPRAIDEVDKKDDEEKHDDEERKTANEKVCPRLYGGVGRPSCLFKDMGGAKMGGC